MRYYTVLFLLLALSLQSCYTTSGYHVVGGSYFTNYSKDTTYYEERMAKFGQDHPELMVDSAFVNKYFKDVPYFSLGEKEQAFQQGRLYPLFPIIDFWGLHTWHLRSPDGVQFYEVGLFFCGSRKTNNNLCNLSLQGVYTVDRGYVKGVYLNDDDKKKKKIFNRNLQTKFEQELLGKIRPYFEDSSK